MCHYPKRSWIMDPQDPASITSEDLVSYIFIFSWDLSDIGSRRGKIIVEY